MRVGMPKDKRNNRVKIDSDEYLISEIKRFYKENERIPVQSDFKGNLEYPDVNKYQRRFGWNNALKLAGFNPNKVDCYSKEELIELLHKFYEKNGNIPRMEDFSGNYEYPSCEPYINRFGSWNNALKAAELSMDNMIKKGMLNVTNDSCSIHKGRLWELTILKSFKNGGAIDVSGQNWGSHFDGICPKNYTYDAKSAKLSYTNNIKYKNRYVQWFFNIKTKNADYLFLGAFDEKFEKLLYAWLIPVSLIKYKSLTISLNKIYKFKKYEITNECNMLMAVDKI
jgi:hypothetical protein